MGLKAVIVHQEDTAAGSYSSGSGGNFFTNFASFVSHKTNQIKETVVRELCTTANKISDALGKVDWKTVGKVAVAVVVTVGVGVVTGGAGLAFATGALGLMQGTLGAAVVAGAVTGAIGGATFGGTYSAISGNSAGQVIKDTLKGGALGSVTGGLAGAAGHGVGKLVEGTKNVINGGSSAGKAPVGKAPAGKTPGSHETVPQKGASGAGNVKVPQKATDIANQVKAKNGTPPQGYKGGKVYQNMPSGSGQKLPKGINYKEYDVNPYIKGQDRGLERIVIGDDGSVWYTNNHYETFTKLE